MRYVTKARSGGSAGRSESTEATIASWADRTAAEPTVHVTIAVFDADATELARGLFGHATVELSADSARRFAENVLRSVDESVERAERVRYVHEVKEVLS